MPENDTSARQPIDRDQARQIWDILMGAEHIGIISHRHPDADTVGSNICLRLLLEKHGRSVESICCDPLPKYCQFLDNTSFLDQLNLQRYDLLVTVDCGSIQQCGFSEIFTGEKLPPLINLDHHASNNSFGDLAIVDPFASSTAEIVFRLLEIWQQRPNRQMATALLAGIYFDSGSFMHSNVTPELLEIASLLTELGANREIISQHLFRNFDENKYHLWGKTLENLRLNEKGTAVAVITPGLADPGTKHEAQNGLIDYVSMLRESKMALLINQDENCQIHGSLRTRYDQIDVAKMAAQLGGGGHRKASGFGFAARLEKETVWSIIK